MIQPEIRILIHGSSGMLKKPGEISIVVNGEELLLNPMKFVYWPARRAIVCADIHIGKGGHFRKSGIALPRMINKNNFWNLSAAFERYKPSMLLVLGDMVHSDENMEWTDFWDFLDNYPKIERVLVKGNHEPEDLGTIRASGFEVIPELRDAGFVFTHEPMEISDQENCYNICGHIHPAIQLYGKARQSVKLPCFWFGAQQAVLPAFGEFTGTHCIKPRRGDRLFAIAENALVKIEE